MKKLFVMFAAAPLAIVSFGAFADSVGDGVLRANSHVRPFIPEDLVALPGQGTSAQCNEDGTLGDVSDGGRCLDYGSNSTGTFWRMRGEGGFGPAAKKLARIFKMEKRQEGGQAQTFFVLQVVFDKSDRGLKTVTYITPDAADTARGYGYTVTALSGDQQGKTLVMKGGPTPTTAAQSPTPAPAPQAGRPVTDCAAISNPIEKTKCILRSKEVNPAK
jgi:hypothetical protein